MSLFDGAAGSFPYGSKSFRNKFIQGGLFSFVQFCLELFYFFLEVLDVGGDGFLLKAGLSGI